MLPPTDRSPAGHRLYDIAALTRLELVRTLRDLGIDIPTIQRVLGREITVPQAAHAHAEALDAQISILRLRRAVLRAATPDLPDDPSAAQLEAWVELADLVQDPDFKASIRRMAEYQAAERADGDPGSERARQVIDELMGLYATAFHKTDTRGYRETVLERLEVAGDAGLLPLKLAGLPPYLGKSYLYEGQDQVSADLR